MKKMIKEWLDSLDSKGFKNYTHFDINPKFKTPQEKFKYFEEFFAKNDISKYNFKPFIRYEIKEKRFVKKENEKPENNYFYESENKNAKLYWHKLKVRPITYASHKDSYIYSYYSFLLWKKYEEFLKLYNLDKNILAYRTVQNINSKNFVWKNNIDFALDVFQDIKNIENCIVFAFDISWFFDTLDHSILKKELIKVLWVSTLTNDWYKILKNLTKFCYVDKADIVNNNLIKRVDIKKKFPKVIDIDKFNQTKEKFKNEWKYLIKTNPDFPEYNDKNPDKKFIWIPQWTPISWMLANLYMNKFDILLKEYVDNLKWKYYRYSDDILLIIPFSDNNFLEQINLTSNFIINKIKEDLKLKINNSKTEISIFSKGKIIKNVEFINNNFCYKNENNITPLQYLWFTFDGYRVLIRNKTLANYYKKLIQSIKRLYHLKGKKKDKNWKIISFNHIKWNRILLWKLNRKYLYNWVDRWKRYIKIDWKYRLDDKDNNKLYLWFLSYWYHSHKVFQKFCKWSINNGIKKQLAWHRKIYTTYLNKLWIK